MCVACPLHTRGSLVILVNGPTELICAYVGCVATQRDRCLHFHISIASHFLPENSESRNEMQIKWVRLALDALLFPNSAVRHQDKCYEIQLETRFEPLLFIQSCVAWYTVRFCWNIAKAKALAFHSPRSRRFLCSTRFFFRWQCNSLCKLLEQIICIHCSGYRMGEWMKLVPYSRLFAHVPINGRLQFSAWLSLAKQPTKKHAHPARTGGKS